MNKIFYDKNRNLEIVDVSGEKSMDEIKLSFGEGDYQSVECDAAVEVVVYENDIPIVKTREEIRTLNEKANKAKKDEAASRLSRKLNAQDIQDIKTLLF